MAHRFPRLTVLLALLASALMLPLAATTAAQEASCADYSSTAAAQFALDINPGLAGALDPDGNGTACDHEGAASGTSSSSTDLQLPADANQTPTPSGALPPATVDAVDQQPTDASTQTGTNVLAGRLGDSQASFATVHGAVIEEELSESNPAIVLRVYPPPPTAFDLYTIDWNDQVAIVVVVAETPWDAPTAAGIIENYLPTDVTTLPQPETLNDGSLLLTTFSQQLSTGVTADMMSQAGLPGVPGDLYMLLITDGASTVAEIEVGIGNGDNVREDINAGGSTTTTTTTTTTTPTPATTTQETPTPATSSTTDAATFLQQARTEVDTLQGEINELRAIINAGTFSEAETQRLSEIIVSWLAIDTSLPTAPPEHSAIATQLQQVRSDISSVGLTLFTALGTGDSSSIAGVGELLTTIETNLASLDQQLTALGF